jgi:serine/threonine protein kinase
LTPCCCSSSSPSSSSPFHVIFFLTFLFLFSFSPFVYNSRFRPGYSSLPNFEMMNTTTYKPYSNLANTFSFLSVQGLDVLDRMLTYNPSKRITAKEALNHPWFSEKPYPKPGDLMPHFETYSSSSLPFFPFSLLPSHLLLFLSFKHRRSHPAATGSTGTSKRKRNDNDDRPSNSKALYRADNPEGRRDRFGHFFAKH